jgi:hypothetical protein
MSQEFLDQLDVLPPYGVCVALACATLADKKIEEADKDKELKYKRQSNRKVSFATSNICTPLFLVIIFTPFRLKVHTQIGMFSKFFRRNSC